MKLLRIKLPDSLHARLKVQAAVHGTSMQHIGVLAFEQWCFERLSPTEKANIIANRAGQADSGNAPRN